MRPHLILLVCCLAYSLTLVPAKAAPTAPADAALAETLFQEGREAMDAKDYETACNKFAESQRLDPGAGALMNWASCEEKLGRVASAWQHWRQARSLMTPDDPRVTYADEQSGKLESRVPRVTLLLSEDSPEGVTIDLDGTELGSASLGTPLPVDPGKRLITVRAPKHAPNTFTLRIDEGETKALKVHAGVFRPEPEPEPEADANPRPSLLPWAWASFGVGAAGVAGAVVTGLLAKNKRDIVNNENNCDGFECNATGAQAAADGKTLVTLNAVAVGVAAVGLGAGITLFVLDKNQSESPNAKTSRKQSRQALTLTPRVGGATLDFGGTF